MGREPTTDVREHQEPLEFWPWAVALDSMSHLLIVVDAHDMWVIAVDCSVSRDTQSLALALSV